MSIFCLFVLIPYTQISHFFIGRKEIHSKIIKANRKKDFFKIRKGKKDLSTANDILNYNS